MIDFNKKIYKITNVIIRYIIHVYFTTFSLKFNYSFKKFKDNYNNKNKWTITFNTK